MTAWAISKLRSLRRCRMATQISARVRGVARAHAGMASVAAWISISGVDRGYDTPSSMPYGEDSLAVVQPSPGWSSSSR